MIAKNREFFIGGFIVAVFVTPASEFPLSYFSSQQGIK